RNRNGIRTGITPYVLYKGLGQRRLAVVIENAHFHPQIGLFPFAVAAKTDHGEMEPARLPDDAAGRDDDIAVPIERGHEPHDPEVLRQDLELAREPFARLAGSVGDADAHRVFARRLVEPDD